MKLKVYIVICLIFTISKGRDSIADAFQMLIHKQPIYQSLIPDMQHSASIDLHMLSRFIKKLKSSPCLLLTEDMHDRTLLTELFPTAEVYPVSSDVHVDAMINKVLNFANVCGGYAAVLTNLPSRADDIQMVHEHIPQLCYFSVDGLIDYEASSYIDMAKLKRLMKRNIHVVCTAALIPIRYEQRKYQYIHSLKVLRGYAYEPYVVESCAAGPTFFDDHCSSVCYTQSNDATLQNKGVNESISLMKALEKWNFKDDDIILKLTGRYVLQSDALLRLLEDADDIAAVAKFEKWEKSSVLTGCFAMRCDLMKEMYASYDYEKLEREMICIEHEVGPSIDQLEADGYKVIRLDHLGVEANVFGGAGTDNILYW